MTARITVLALALLIAFAGISQPILAQSGGQAITGITFDWGTYQTQASGSDNWPLAWCEDGHQYTSWGDGGGFGGTNQDGRVSLGFARIEGDYPNFTGHNVWGGKDPESNDPVFSGKVVSMICMNGNLYAWRSSGSNYSAFRWKQIIRSTDKGRSWDADEFPESQLEGDAGLPGLPYFLDYGQNYSANSDGYVYIYTIRIDNPDVWEVQKPGVIWLARAPAANEAFIDLSNWEWYTGSGPTWGSIDNRAAVIQDNDGFMRNSAMYVPGLNRYVMVANHTARNEGNIVIYEAPQPWGPWSVVMKKDGWPADETSVVSPSFAFGNFSPKWLSTDGRDCVFVWFRPDDWNSVECRFETGGTTDVTPPPAPTSLNASASGTSTVDLSWNAVSDPESGINRYIVYRDGSQVGNPSQTSYTDSGLNAGTTYSYEVAAVNGVGLESPKSQSASATTNDATDTTPPPAPSSLNANATGRTTISLSWAAVSDPESGISSYIVYRDGSQVGSPTQTNFSDSGLNAGTTYSYQVAAVNGVGLEGPKSASASATTAPPTSEGLVVNIVAASGLEYRAVEDAFQAGSIQYIDRDHTFASQPQELEGALYIQTANDDKAENAGSSEFLTFDITYDAVVYVAHDDRLDRPAWLSADFVDVGLDVVSTDGNTRFSLFARQFTTGRVTLGANADTPISLSSMYTVIVDNSGVDLIPPAPPSGLRVSGS